MEWSEDEFTGKRFGKYEVLCRLAVGGMAELFLAFPRSGDHLGEPVVLKRILADQREDENALQMLLDEAKLTATLNHPNVARVLDLEVDGEEVLLVIELIAGANMEEIVAIYQERQEAVPLGMTLTVVREAAQGLAHAHAHLDAKGRPSPIVHRDVTPRNIMVDFEGVTKMLDFGIARAMGTQRRTVAGMVRGTTAYMSPEQAIGKDVDPLSDIFSLGVIFHELLTGQRLFAKTNPGEEMAAVYEGEIPLPSRVNRRVPKPLDAVVMRALEREKSKRYQNGLELIRDLLLTAGSTAWSHERCAEAVREKFAGRRIDVSRLVATIPLAELGAQPAPSAPEARTLIASRGGMAAVSPSMTSDEDGSKTVLAAGLLNRTPVSLRSTDPERELQAGRAKRGGGTELGAEPLADTKRLEKPKAGHVEASQTLEGTEIADLTMGSTTGETPLPESPPRPQVVRRKRPAGQSAIAHAPPKSSASTAMVIVVGVVAIIVGVLGGLVISSWFANPSKLGKLSVAADRPVEVLIGDQSLGRTPLKDVLLPEGSHVLRLKENNGKKRELTVTVSSTQPARVEAKLDQLPVLK